MNKKVNKVSNGKTDLEKEFDSEITVNFDKIDPEQQKVYSRVTSHAWGTEFKGRDDSYFYNDGCYWKRNCPLLDRNMLPENKLDENLNATVVTKSKKARCSGCGDIVERTFIISLDTKRMLPLCSGCVYLFCSTAKGNC